MRDRLIVALDVENLEAAARLMDLLGDAVRLYKVGTQLFTAAGPAAVELVHKRGGRVFLDLKYHDIPNTVAGAVREAARLGVFMLDVHAAGGSAMIRAGAEAIEATSKQMGIQPPVLLAVTVLTSMTPWTLKEELRVGLPLEEAALHLARLALLSGADGVVASPHEVIPLRQTFGPGVVIVTPGVRPRETAANDQARIMAPGEAIRAGASYIVVGRPITRAPDPAGAARQILDAMGTAR